jgi:hypothetical protein
MKTDSTEIREKHIFSRELLSPSNTSVPNASSNDVFLKPKFYPNKKTKTLPHFGRAQQPLRYPLPYGLLVGESDLEVGVGAEMEKEVVAEPEAVRAATPPGGGAGGGAVSRRQAGEPGVGGLSANEEERWRWEESRRRCGGGRTTASRRSRAQGGK